jgi:hypothetical protein
MTANKSPWSMTWNSAGQNGTVTIAVTAVDAAGNTGTSTTSVDVDNTAPSSAVTLAPTATGVTPVALAAPADDLARMDLYVKGVLAASATAAPWEIPLDTTGLAGAVQLKIVSADLAGNSSSSNVSLKIDNDGPKLAWKTPAVGPAAVLRGTITVGVQATDASGVASVELLDGNGNAIGVDETAPYSFPVDTTQFDGATTLTLRATDQLGLTSTLDKTITFDNTAPEVSLDLPPVSRGVLQLIPAVGDNIAVKSVKTILTLPNGRTGNLAASMAPWKMTWSSTGVTGTVTATTTATDTAGNATTTTTSFGVDSTAPSVAFTIPVRSATGFPVALTAPSEDTVKMELLIRGQLIGTVTSAPWSIDFDPAGATGSIPLTIRTTDAAGNVSTLAKAVTVDTTGPAIRLMSTTKVTGAAAAVRPSVTDPSGVTLVELIRDGQVVTSSVKAPFAMTVDTTAFPKGNQIWTLRATDSVGNVSTVDLTYTVS